MLTNTRAICAVQTNKKISNGLCCFLLVCFPFFCFPPSFSHCSSFGFFFSHFTIRTFADEILMRHRNIPRPRPKRNRGKSVDPSSRHACDKFLLFARRRREETMTLEKVFTRFLWLGRFFFVNGFYQRIFWFQFECGEVFYCCF